MTRALAPIASLRLTVVLFALAMVLIFAGTLAQRELGNWEAVDTYFRSFFVMIPLRHLIFYDVPGALPFPGGFILGGLMLVNLLAAHAVRFSFTWKRAGVLLTHLGLILLLVGEFVTAAGAEEGMMTLHEGSYASYAEDLRETEIAVIRRLDDGREEVIAIPESRLVAAEAAEPIDLSGRGVPLAVRVIEWMPNSGLAMPERLAEAGVSIPSRASVGNGTRVVAVRQPTVTGTDLSNVNQPSAYVELLDAGRSLGTYLVSVNFGAVPMLTPRQTIRVGGEDYEVDLRFKRLYKPYTLHLLEARHDVFVGTDIPRNFSSRVRLVDAEANEDREVLIWMNHPLRYRGDAIFQSQMDAAGAARGVPMSGLQVVTNPGWLLPYIACAIVSVGLVWHFGAMLSRFVSRRAKA